MQPHQLRKLVRKWTALVVILAVLGAVAAYLYSRTLTPLYVARGGVLVVAGPGQGSGAADVALNAAQVTATAATLMTEPPLLQKVIDQNHLTDSVDGLAGKIAVSPQSNTEVVDVSVSDTNPAQAALIDNSLMTAFVSQVTQQNTDRINQAGAALQSQISQVQATVTQEEQDLATALKANQDTTALRAAVDANTALLSQLTLNYSSFKATQSQNLGTVSIAAPARTPLAPSSPRPVLNAALGGLAGLIFGLALVALLEFLDQGLKSPEDVRDRLGVPCLGVVPRYDVSKAPTGTRKQKRQAQVANEAYRGLRTNLLFTATEGDLKSVVLTSARAGEGKTRTAANLAIALAGSDKRVVLVDADMRRPQQHRVFGKTLANGMSELILATSPGNIPGLNGSHTTEHPNLSLITSGTIPPNPSELLASKRAALLLHSLAGKCDIMIIDTPPADVVTDALSIAADASATVVVVEAGRTNAGQAAAVIASLRRVGANVVGVVLNKSSRRAEGGYYYHYGYSEDEGGVPAAEPVSGPIG